jgi:hypothetical protein
MKNVQIEIIILVLPDCGKPPIFIEREKFEGPIERCVLLSENMYPSLLGRENHKLVNIANTGHRVFRDWTFVFGTK